MFNVILQANSVKCIAFDISIDYVRVIRFLSLRGCLKKIDKIAFSIVLGVVSLSVIGKSGNFEQNLVWLGLNSQF